MGAVLSYMQLKMIYQYKAMDKSAMYSYIKGKIQQYTVVDAI